MNPVTVTLDGHTLDGTPDAIAAILTALPTPRAPRPTGERTEPKPQAQTRTTRTVRTSKRKGRRNKIVVPALSEANDTYLRTLYKFGPEIPVTGRGTLIAAHLLDGEEHTSKDIQARLGVHHQTIGHTIIRLRQGGCQVEIDGVPMKTTKQRFSSTATIRVTRVGTPAQARKARGRYATSLNGTAKVPASVA